MKSKISSVISLADNSLTLEAMTMSSAKLLEKGYIKLDGKALARFSPVIGLIESLGFQKWVGRTQAKDIEKLVSGSYRCIVKNQALNADMLAKAKDS